VACEEADVPLFENFVDCCLAELFGLVRDSLGELCGEYVD
jgi:hypothetical protein